MAGVKPPFPKNVVFTANYPLAAADLPKNAVVAVKVGGADAAKPEDIQKLKDAGYQIAIWQSQSDQEGIDAVSKYGAVAYIGQAESVAEAQAYSAVSSQVNVPKAVVTTVTGIYGPGGVQLPTNSYVMVEAYPNQNPNATPKNMFYEATRAGAKPSDIIIAIGAYGQQSAYGGVNISIDQYIADLKAMGITNFATYIAESLSGPDKAQLAAWLDSQGVSTSSTATSTSTSSHTQSSSQAGKKSARIHVNSSATVKPVNPHAKSVTQVKKPKYPGITGPHQAAGADGAPKAYTGGAAVVNDPKQTFSFTDKVGRRVTITTTASGAKIEQVAGHTPYNIKRATAAPARTPISDASKPAWHQNTAWAAPAADTAAKARVDANTVLEQRPGANGNTILRMADGTYKSYNPNTGQTTGAGTWNKDQWDSTHHGQQVAGGGGSNPDGGGSQNPSNDNSNPAPTTAATPTSEQPHHVFTQQDQFASLLNRDLKAPTTGGVSSGGPPDPFGTATYSNDQKPDPGVTGLVGESVPGGRGGV